MQVDFSINVTRQFTKDFLYVIDDVPVDLTLYSCDATLVSHSTGTVMTHFGVTATNQGKLTISFGLDQIGLYLKAGNLYKYNVTITDSSNNTITIFNGNISTTTESVSYNLVPSVGFIPVAANSVSNNSLFVDVSTGSLSFKNSNGTVAVV